MANPRFKWDPQGYTEFMHSDGVIGFIEQKARLIVADANAASNHHKRQGKPAFAYKVLPGEKKPVAIIHTASFVGMYEQSKNKVLKKALMKHKQTQNGGGDTNG